MKRFFVVTFFAVSIVTAQAAPVDLPVNKASYSTNKIRLDSDNFGRYRKLASSIGLDYDRTYSYSEWADTSRANHIGVAGAYEWLAYSTGGDPNLIDTDMRAQKVPIHWEALYYSNIDMTIIHQVTHSGGHSFVKLLKLARGRVPDLYRH